MHEQPSLMISHQVTNTNEALALLFRVLCLVLCLVLCFVSRRTLPERLELILLLTQFEPSHNSSREVEIKKMKFDFFIRRRDSKGDHFL